jgi:hypothetical protein
MIFNSSTTCFLSFLLSFLNSANKFSLSMGILTSLNFLNGFPSYRKIVRVIK